MVDACSQALAVMLLDSSGAEAWIAYARRKAIEAGAVIVDPATGMPVPRPAIEPPPPRNVRAGRRSEPEDAPEAPLEGVVLSDAERRKLARDQAYRATPDAFLERAVMGRRR